MSSITYHPSLSKISLADEQFDNFYVKKLAVGEVDRNSAQLLQFYFDSEMDSSAIGWEYFRNELEFE